MSAPRRLAEDAELAHPLAQEAGLPLRYDVAGLRRRVVGAAARGAAPRVDPTVGASGGALTQILSALGVAGVLTVGALVGPPVGPSLVPAPRAPAARPLASAPEPPRDAAPAEVSLVAPGAPLPAALVTCDAVDFSGAADVPRSPPGACLGTPAVLASSAATDGAGAKVASRPRRRAGRRVVSAGPGRRAAPISEASPAPSQASPASLEVPPEASAAPTSPEEEPTALISEVPPPEGGVARADTRDAPAERPFPGLSLVAPVEHANLGRIQIPLGKDFMGGVYDATRRKVFK